MLFRSVIKEVRVDRSAIERGDRGIVVGEIDDVGFDEMGLRISFLQRALDDAQASLGPWNGDDRDAETAPPAGTLPGSPPSAFPAIASSLCGVSCFRVRAQRLGAATARHRPRAKLAKNRSISTFFRAQSPEPSISLQTHSRANGK